MSVPFERSTRSIQANNIQVVLVGLITMIILMFLWSIWFFFAPIEFYETSQRASLNAQGEIVAKFDQEKLNRIQLGQTAIFQFERETDKLESILAIVAEINATNGEILLFPQTNTTYLLELHDLKNSQIQVIVETATPAQLLMRATGLSS